MLHRLIVFSEDVALVFFNVHVCVRARVCYVDITGQIEQVTDYPVRWNQVCVGRGGQRSEEVRLQEYLYILISPTPKAFSSKLYTPAMKARDFLHIVVFKSHFCSLKTQK